MTKEEYLEHIKNNELRNREPDIYDIEDAYIEGYKEAVDKAYKWLKSNTYSVFIKSCSLFDAVEEFVGNFKQEMKGGEK